MMDWMFKKKPESPATADSPSTQPAAPEGPRPDATAQDIALWQARLEAATGDDAALLEVAKQAPTIALKCAAIAALAEEAALKLAEREFRTHDRRVHSAAKQRLDGAVAQRLARAGAAGLIESATALLAEPTIPTNRLVELDRAWHALDAALLDEAQKTEFNAVSSRLTELTREHGEHALQVERWTRAARQALQDLNSVEADVVAGARERGEMAAVLAAVQAARQNRPADAPAAALDLTLGEALQQSAHIEARLVLLEQWRADAAPPAVVEAPPAEAALAAAEPTEVAPATVAPPPEPQQAWQALPPVNNAKLAAVLEQRFEQWQADQAALRQAGSTEQQQQRKAARQAAKQEARQARAESLAPLLQQAETALEAGNLTQTHTHLLAIDAFVGGGAAPEALRERLGALHAEYARLKGWQHWGGGRARDDLVQEAQTLASATAAALADPKQAAKLPVKQLADAIDAMRQRWKELDRLGGATSQALWKDFDAALKSAHGPVAAHLDVQKARRRDNLEARFQLIHALDAVAGAQDAPEPTDAADPAAAPPPRREWKEQVRALDHFQTEWRKLGPVEHTVPHKARDKLMQRMQASVARLEAPLQDARRVAQQGREQLVARANELSAQAAARPDNRDLIARVRELQEEWQQHARTLPLTRPVENALWAQFKAATDAVFAQRDAASNAFEAQLHANLLAKEALVARLQALTDQSPAHEIQRALAEVDVELRKVGEVPRNKAAALDGLIRTVHQNTLALLARSAQAGWHQRFDGLSARLALCEALEAPPTDGRAAPAVDDPASAWAALAPLPAAWEKALAGRLKRAGESKRSSPTDADLDAILLHLESTLAIASPPDLMAARRNLKLRALKEALEGRPSASAARLPTGGVDEWLAAALALAPSHATQRDRLGAIIAALRAKGPG